MTGSGDSKISSLSAFWRCADVRTPQIDRHAQDAPEEADVRSLCPALWKRRATCIYRTRLLRTGWKAETDTKLHLDGLTLDTIWQNLIVYIGDITLEPQRTLDEQIQFDAEQEKRTAEIERLEKLARKETQPRKKLELFEKIQELKNGRN